MRAKRGYAARLHSRVCPVTFSALLDIGKGSRDNGVFAGATRGISRLSCHVTTQTTGTRPHPVHSHKEEEILLLVAGELEVIAPEVHSVEGNERVALRPGQIVYYPAFFPHTVETTSEEPAKYIALEWFNRRRTHASAVKRFGVFDVDFDEDVADGFSSRLAFREPTRYLKKLQCHTTVAAPGKGQASHSDEYDVVLALMQGEIQTLGDQARAYDVVLYAADELHGMLNARQETARLVAFELHGITTNLVTRMLAAAWSLFIRACKKILRFAGYKDA